MFALASRLPAMLALVLVPTTAAARPQVFEELHRAMPLRTENTSQPFLADFDDDGDLDAMCAGFLPILYLNDGQAHFSECEHWIASAASVYPIAIGDLDGDGDVDALAMPAAVWLNARNGSFVLGSGQLALPFSGVIVVLRPDERASGSLQARDSRHSAVSRSTARRLDPRLATGRRRRRRACRPARS